MKKHLLLLTLFSFSILYSSAQYATMGTGTLRNEIWWLDWAGITITNGASRTFNTTDGLTVTVSVSNVSSIVPVPEVMNTWNGAILHLLYDFTDPAVKPALLSMSNPGICSFTMNIAAYRSGVQVPFTFIAADAEASLPSEVTTLKTNGSNWQTITLFRNSSQTTNPLTGCNTQMVSITDTYANAPQTGQNPIVSTSSGSGSMTVDVAMNHTVYGGMAVAFGIMAPIDRGDLPTTYGTAQHLSGFNINNGCNYLAPLPSISPVQSLYLGAVPGDADGYQTTDDNASGVDEECLSSIPAYTNGSGTYSLQIPLVNTTGSNAYLSGWFDYNRNGVFDIGEFVSAIIANNATTATLTWTGLPAYLPVGAATGYGFRFRLSSDQASVQSAAGNAPDGEVEDYFVTSSVLCAPITVATIADTSLCVGKSVQLTTTGTGPTQYSWNTSSYLDNGNTASPVATPAATTKYIVTGSTPQACEAKDTVTVSILPLPDISVTSDFSICSGNNHQVFAFSTGAVSYNWSPQTGLDNATVSSPMATPTVTTKYVVLVQGSNGCFNKDSVNVFVLPAPGFAVNAVQPVCEKQPVLLSASGGDDYTWVAGDNSLVGNTASVTVKPNATQNYRVLIKNYSCQMGTILTVPVTVNPLPVISSTNDVGVCAGASTQLSAVAVNAISYAWSPQTGLDNSAITNPMATPTATTEYVVLVQGSNGCFNRDTVNVSVKPLPVISISNDVTICSGKNTQLSATSPGAVSYNWSPQVGLDNSAINNPIATPTDTTKYVVLVQGSNGCFNKDSVNVLVHPTPVFAVNTVQPVCEKQPVLLSASGGDDYTWLASDNSVVGNTASVTVQPAITQNYRAVITDNICQMSSTLTVPVTVNSLPVISIGNDVTICSGKNTQLTATAAGAISYNWSPQTGLDNAAIGNPTAAPAADTKYVVLVEGSNGCFNKDSVNVLVHPLPVFAVNAVQPVCEKQSVLLSASGGDDYTWFAKDNSVVGNAASVSVQPDSTQDYRVLIEDATCQLSSTLTVPVTVNELPEPAITKANDIDCSHNQAVLHVSGGASYTWDAAAGITDYTSSDPAVNPFKTTTYYVTVTGDNGCTVKDSITVAVDVTKAIGTYPVPSAFTPNNDGKNDCFGLKFWLGTTNLQFDVFNRWGQRVFSGSNATQCWDGTFKGIQQPPGGYIYQIKATTVCGTVSRKGIVMLIR